MAARAPLVRFPFLWAFLVGIIALTLVRPCLRRVPDPPPVTGRFPDEVLVDPEGRPFGRDAMRGSVWVVAILGEGCGEPCAGAARHLVELDETLAALRVGGIRFLEVVAGAEPLREARPAPAAGDPPRRLAVTGEPEVVRRFTTVLCGVDEPAAPGCLAIVDAEGNLRGHYAADADGFNEVYNRVRHVRDARVEEREP